MIPTSRPSSRNPWTILGLLPQFWYVMYVGNHIRKLQRPNRMGFSFDPIGAVERLFTFTPDSFKLDNIMGALGSFTGNVLTGFTGSIIAPEIFSAHSDYMKTLGKATIAVGAAAVGAGLGGGLFGTLATKLTSAASLLSGAGLDQLKSFGKFLGFFDALPQAGKEVIQKVATPEQIAHMEETGNVPQEWVTALGAPPPPSGMVYTSPTKPGGVAIQSYPPGTTLTQMKQHTALKEAGPLLAIGGGALALLMLNR